MSYRGRRKMGMFDHAKYSQPVFRNISQSVLKAVKKDVAALLQNPVEQATNSHPLLGRKRQRSPSSGPSKEKNGNIFASGFQGNSMPFPQRMQPENNIRELFDSTPLLRNEGGKSQNTGKIGFLNKIWENHLLLLHSEDSNDDFPEKPPLKKIVDQFMQSHPSVTLRPNEPTTMSDAAFSLVRGALIAAKQRNLWKERAGAGQSNYSEKDDKNMTNKNPFRTLSDQTLFIQDEIFQAQYSSKYYETTPNQRQCFDAVETAEDDEDVEKEIQNYSFLETMEGAEKDKTCPFGDSFELGKSKKEDETYPFFLESAERTKMDKNYSSLYNTMDNVGKNETFPLFPRDSMDNPLGNDDKIYPFCFD